MALYGEVLSTLLDNHVPLIGQILKKYNISSHEFFNEWIQDLLFKRIPIQLQEEFIGNFLREGWPYFFRVCVTILFSLKNEIVEKSIMSNQKQEILNILTFRNVVREESPSAMENFNDVVERNSPANGEENFNDDDYI